MVRKMEERQRRLGRLRLALERFQLLAVGGWPKDHVRATIGDERIVEDEQHGATHADMIEHLRQLRMEAEAFTAEDARLRRNVEAWLAQRLVRDAATFGSLRVIEVLPGP